jgi:DNA polymerase-3 subunit delta
VLEFATAADPRELVGEIVALAADKGLQLERAAAAALAELGAGDLQRIDGELEKVRAWLGSSGREVSSEQVRELAAGSGILSGWEVADAVLQRDLPAALLAVRRLVEAGDEPLRLLGGLAFRLRGMLRAKALIEQGVAPLRAVGQAGLWGGEAQRIARGLARYELDELLCVPALLFQADWTLKSRGIPAGMVLESLVERLVAPGQCR